MPPRRLSRIPMLPAAALAAWLLGSCAPQSALPLSDRYGEVRPPDGKQALVVVLKDGSEIEIRKLQEEHDTLYVVRTDYSFRSIPGDSVQSIRNVDRKELPGSAAAWRGPADPKKDKEGGEGGSAFMAILTNALVLGALIWLLVATR
jgi:hypothetical protein